MWPLDCITDGEPRICVPMSDVINGQEDKGLKLLLGTGGKGSQMDFAVEIKRMIIVPLVIVFTMFDLIVHDDLSHGNEYEKARAMAYMTWEGRCRAVFGNVRAEIVSSNYSPVCVAQQGCLTLFSAQPRFGDMIAKLVATTDEVINGHISASSKAQGTESRMSPVTLAWSVSQRASLGINVQAAIQRVTSFLLLPFFLLIPYDRVGKSRE